MSIDYSIREQQTKEFIDFLSNHTDMTLDLSFLKYHPSMHTGKNKQPYLKFGQNVKIENVVQLLKDENAWWKNQCGFENVCFAWSKSNDGFNIASVNDIKNVNKFKTKNHFILIETFENRYQGFFRLSRFVSAQEMLEIQKTLADLYQGDMNSINPFHLKLFPGFVNMKYYNISFIIKVIYRGDNIIDVDEILNYIRKRV